MELLAIIGSITYISYLAAYLIIGVSSVIVGIVNIIRYRCVSEERIKRERNLFLKGALPPGVFVFQ